MRARALFHLFLGLAWGGAAAQVPLAAGEDEVKAAFLFKFASFVEWPVGTFQRADEPLVIGVAGDDGVAASL